MTKYDLRFRQIHLDFHTSEVIADIGSEFEPDEFARTLAEASVDSITCFARCHHGWMYYDTEKFPERRHPHLTRDLLREQINACHAKGIRVPIYTTVQWDHYTANQHPEWVCIDKDGKFIGTPPFEAGFYQCLCVNSPYVDFLKAHVRELLTSLPVDGLFFDIVQPVECCCSYCRAGMETLGLEPSDQSARQDFALLSINNFKRGMTAYVRQFNSECTIFYNAGHIGTRHRDIAQAYTHFELESLPSGGWGYLHFPMAMRYARTLGLDCLGMTGKFHTSWGDFHSFKNQAALEFECFRMLAMNAKCSIGDQLHPLGKIDQHVYDLIGNVYHQIEKKEPWCKEAKPVVDIGVLTPEEFQGAAIGNMPPALMGANRMLEEGSQQFDIIDSRNDFSTYRLLVLPDNIPVAGELASKLSSYLRNGGALIASYESGIGRERNAFCLSELGIEVTEEGPTDNNGRLARGREYPQNDFVEYLLPGEAIGKGLPLTELAMYIRGMEIASTPGSEVLANIISSYFDRNYRHFCSHRQTPSSGLIAHPGVVRHGNAIYFSNPIFTQYNSNAPVWCKKLFLNALSMLMPEPLLSHDGPSTVLSTVNEQKLENRWVVHLLHYIPERRSQNMDVIEDVIPLFNLNMTVRIPKSVKQVTLEPQGEALPYKTLNDKIEFAVPQIYGHQMIVLHFA